MSGSGLKARDVEALVYIQSPHHRGAARERRRPRSLIARATTAGAAAVMAVAAALAWLHLRS